MQWSVIRTLTPAETAVYHPSGFSYNPFLNYRNGYHAVSNNSSHTLLSDLLLHLRQHAPITTVLKGLFLQRSKSPQVRGHLWPLVSTTTARQSPRLSWSLHLHPHTQTHSHTQRRLLSPNSCASKETLEREVQPKHLRPCNTFPYTTEEKCSRPPWLQSDRR